MPESLRSGCARATCARSKLRGLGSCAIRSRTNAASRGPSDLALAAPVGEKWRCSAADMTQDVRGARACPGKVEAGFPKGTCGHARMICSKAPKAHDQREDR